MSSHEDYELACTNCVSRICDTRDSQCRSRAWLAPATTAPQVPYPAYGQGGYDGSGQGAQASPTPGMRRAAAPVPPQYGSGTGYPPLERPIFRGPSEDAHPPRASATTGTGQSAPMPFVRESIEGSFDPANPGQAGTKRTRTLGSQDPPPHRRPRPREGAAVAPRPVQSRSAFEYADSFTEEPTAMENPAPAQAGYEFPPALPDSMSQIHWRGPTYDCTLSSCDRKGDNGFNTAEERDSHINETHKRRPGLRKRPRARAGGGGNTAADSESGEDERFSPPTMEASGLFDCMVEGCHRKGSEGFNRETNLRRHVRDQHGKMVRTRDRARKEEAGGFDCNQPHCNKSYGHANTLAEHLRDVHKSVAGAVGGAGGHCVVINYPESTATVTIGWRPPGQARGAPPPRAAVPAVPTGTGGSPYGSGTGYGAPPVNTYPRPTESRERTSQSGSQDDLSRPATQSSSRGNSQESNASAKSDHGSQGRRSGGNQRRPTGPSSRNTKPNRANTDVEGDLRRQVVQLTVKETKRSDSQSTESSIRTSTSRSSSMSSTDDRKSSKPDRPKKKESNGAFSKRNLKP